MNRRSFLAAAMAGPLAAPAIASTNYETDDTNMLQAALNREPIIRLDDRVYRVRPGVLRITQPRQRIVGPSSHAGVYGLPTIQAIGSGAGPLLHVASHGVVLEGIKFEGNGGRALFARRDPVGWGDLDTMVVGCTFTNSSVGVTVEGRGLFLDKCWFSHNRTHVSIGFPSSDELADPREHWQTAEGGARKYQICGSYFHHGSFASIAVVSPLIHGLQVTGCHHDGPQPFIVGPLNMASITGNAIYRLRNAGIVITDDSDGAVISGNIFGGERGGEKMGPAISVRAPVSNVSITGNSRTWASGPGIEKRTKAKLNAATNGNSWGVAA